MIEGLDFDVHSDPREVSWDLQRNNGACPAHAKLTITVAPTGIMSRCPRRPPLP